LKRQGGEKKVNSLCFQPRKGKGEFSPASPSGKEMGIAVLYSRRRKKKGGTPSLNRSPKKGREKKKKGGKVEKRGYILQNGDTREGK